MHMCQKMPLGVGPQAQLSTPDHTVGCARQRAARSRATFSGACRTLASSWSAALEAAGPRPGKVLVSLRYLLASRNADQHPRTHENKLQHSCGCPITSVILIKLKDTDSLLHQLPTGKLRSGLFRPLLLTKQMCSENKHVFWLGHFGVCNNRLDNWNLTAQ